MSRPGNHNQFSEENDGGRVLLAKRSIKRGLGLRNKEKRKE